MNEEFVTYKQASDLKKIGFSEPCLFAFDNCSTPMRCSDLRTNDQKFNGVNYNSSSYTSQPTFFQAFSWFRNLKDLHGCVDLQACTPSHWFVRIDKISVNDYLFHSEDHEMRFETYTEAQNFCPEKLIEIVKNES